MHFNIGALLIDITWSPDLFGVRELRRMRLRHPIRYRQWKKYAWTLGYFFQRRMTAFERQIWRTLFEEHDRFMAVLDQDTTRCVLYNSIEDFEP